MDARGVCGALLVATSLVLTPDISGIPQRAASIVLQGSLHSSSPEKGEGKERNGGKYMSGRR
ncbi:Uncharacterized protein DAT39_004847, partial [Clarias magur]